MLRRSSTVLLALLLLSGCHRETKTVLAKVDVDAEELLKESALGWFPGELTARVADVLRTNGLPVLKESEEPPSGAQVLKARLSLVSEEQAAHDSTPGEVAVAGVLQLAGKGLGVISSVSARRQLPLTGKGPEDRREVTVRAVEGVLDEVAGSAGALVKASTKSDEELVKALAGPDPLLKKFAVKLLASRGNSAAVPPLLEQLKAEDLNVVREAIGSLVELHDPRSVGPLIDASHARSNLFQREVVFALGSIGGEEAEAYLFTMAQGHDEPAIRASAQQALDELKAKAKQEGGGK